MLKIAKMAQLIKILPTLWAQGLFAHKADQVSIGGQAVIEGVLIKGPQQWGLAVRRPNGEIFKDKWLNNSMVKRYPWKLPILRGFVTMVEMMGTGFRALSKSAEIALEGTDEKLTSKDLFIAICIGIVAVVGLFIALPMWLAEAAAGFFSLPAASSYALEGVMRSVVFVGYVASVGLMENIRQVFRYHGAEHKTIHAYEKENKISGADKGNAGLTPEAISLESRIHPRCGTSFMLVAILMSIVVFSIIGQGSLMWRLGSRITLLPLLIGISYEVIRLATRSGFIGRAIISPVLPLQYLTTREPDIGQIEVALTSLNVALERE